MTGPCTSAFWQWTVLMLTVTTAAATAQGCPTVVLYGSTTVLVSRMTSYTMTGDTREGRPVYYSNATCDFLYYKCGNLLGWCVGTQIGGDQVTVKVTDSHLYANEINGTFFLAEGGQLVENTDVKIACSDDAPAGAVVPQPVSNITNCSRVRLQGDVTYQRSLLTTYTRTDQTSGGRPVYLNRGNRFFLYFISEQNRWFVGQTIGQAHGGAYVFDCAMTPDQTRPVWYLYDGSSKQWRFAQSVYATCAAAMGPSLGVAWVVVLLNMTVVLANNMAAKQP